MNRRFVPLSTLLSAAVSFGCMNALAQTPYLPSAYPSTMPVNYVRTWNAMKPESNSLAIKTTVAAKDFVMTTQYLDGLGRPVQTVSKNSSHPTGYPAKDMISMNTYDEFGREAYSFLPTPATGNGGNTSVNDGMFKLNPFEQQLLAYSNTFVLSPVIGQEQTYYYSKTNFEASPLNRVTEIFAPGNSWVGTSLQANEADRRSVKIKYLSNTADDDVRIWNVNINASIGSFSSYASPGEYSAGLLLKTITIDEHNSQLIEFKDKGGKIILKKVQVSGAGDIGAGVGHTDDWICTYYLYDDLNNLRCVVQPEGVKALAGNGWDLSATTLLNEQCFRYEYDERDRMIVKKVPGAGEVFMVYDVRDRLVLTQDGNLRTQDKWLFTKYDALNRPTITGLFVDNTHIGQSTMQNYLNSQSLALWETYNPGGFPLYTINQSFPSIAGSNGEILTFTYYDDYSYAQAHGPDFAAKDNSFDIYFDLSSAAFPYAEPLTASGHTKGLITGQWTSLPGGGTLLGNFYDAKGRLIQSKYFNQTAGPANYNGGMDITTIQYSFSGQVLQTVQRHEKAGANPQTYLQQTRNIYNELGRLITVQKKLTGTVNSQPVSVNNGAWTTISSLSYDGMGQLKTKTLSPDFAGGAGLEAVTYDYNIRGWMLGANRDYARDETNNHYFGFDLGYDKTNNNLVGGQQYNIAQYNGNISGMVWKSRGNGEKRKYDFVYDGASRLLKGDFTQYDGSVFNQSADINFSMKMGDGVNHSSAYDANGNIRKMQQWGRIIGQSLQVDNLDYSYSPGTNKLLKVKDNVTADHKLGDFKDGSSGDNDDYTYDVSGNLTSDLNKAISSITYNHLNLPLLITIPGKGTIAYTYDPAGVKQKKVTVDNTGPQTKTTTTLYIGGYVYENDVLQFIGHEEGRIRFKPSDNSFHYDYMLKDHLGNVRMVLTEEQKQDAYPVASMEDVADKNNLSDPANYIPYYSNTDYVEDNSVRYPTPSADGYPTSTGNDYVARLKGDTRKIGPSVLLKVMAGDKFNLRVFSWWNTSTTPSGTTSPLTDLAAALLSSVPGVSGGKIGAGQLTSGVLTPGLTGFLGDPKKVYNGALPKAYINWVLLDEQFQFVESSSNAEQVGASGAHTFHEKDNLPVHKNGYLYIYVSNETDNINVYFDDLQVTHVRGRLLEESHYYPFGLTMAGISSKALSFGGPENKKKFNGIEQNNSFDINTYEAFYRSADPQIGRWWQIDPKPNMAESPYAMMANNPLSNNDPLGDTAVVRWRSGFLGLGQRHEARYVGDQWVDSKTRQTVDVSDASKSARRMMNDYNGLNQNSDFNPVTDKINTNEANVVLTNSKKAEADPNNAFRSGTSKELVVNLSQSAKFRAELNVGNVAVTLNSQQVMGHELGHVYDILNGKPASHFTGEKFTRSGYIGITIAPSETNAMYWENILRAKAGLPLRRQYFYHSNPIVNWNGGDAIIKYDPKTGQPTSVSDLDGNTFPIKK
jgi:RHS repeat-associated protein